MTLERLENESALDYKYRLLLSKAKEESEYSWDEIEKTLKLGIAKDTIRKGSIFLPEFDEYARNKYSITQELPNYKEINEYKADGTYVSDKLLKLAEDDLKNPDKLLESHGFDKTKWQLTGARNSLWNSSVDKTLHSSRITVKPKVDGFDIEEAIERAIKNIKPYKSTVKIKQGKNLLEIFLTDMHFGVNSFEYYKDTLDEIVELIESKKWDTIYIPFGSDLLHNNNFKGDTANGTPIEKVNMEKAWDDAFDFYHVIYTKSLENAVNVVSDYVCGNHDKDFTYGLIRTFSKLFSEIKWDTSPKNKKVFTWKEVALLVMHGDKGSSRISKTIYKEYGKLISDKKVVEIHTGDKHHTKTDDSHGVIFRILPTKAQTDEWHEEQSFTGSMKCFHIFEYAEDKLKTIYHI